jgi:hypothetical protein
VSKTRVDTKCHTKQKAGTSWEKKGFERIFRIISEFSKGCSARENGRDGGKNEGGRRGILGECNIGGATEVMEGKGVGIKANGGCNGKTGGGSWRAKRAEKKRRISNIEY